MIQIIEAAKSWQESWIALVNSQFNVADVYANLYDPIVGASDGHGRPSAQTPELQLHRTFKLKEVYADLKTELDEEINSIEERIIRAGNDARQSIAPIRKTVKKREDKRIDVERTQEKVHKLHRKMGRTPKEESSLAKAEDELAAVTEVQSSARCIKRTLLTHVSRNLKSLIHTYERPYLPSSRRHSVSSPLCYPYTSSSRTGCLAYTIPCCTATARRTGFHLRHHPWTM